MTKIILPTMMQAKVINKPKDKRVIVIDTGYRSGKSTALLFKALQSECRDCTIINPTYKSAENAFQEAYKLLQPMGFRASFNSLILSNDKFNKKIKFIGDHDCESMSGLSRELVMFDNTDTCDKETIYHQSRKAKDLVFTVDSLSGSFIKYKPDYDEDGTVIPNRFIVDYKESHWSVILLEGIYLEPTDSSLSKGIYSGMYRDDVYLVRGSSFG
tara:strand:- start:403 stop:1044 length:642 start_codon:yes stop_codon:yes gene_type:complete